VKKAVSAFDVIQSVDSLELAGEIDRRSAEIGRRMSVLVEVNTSGEESKFGSRPEECVDLVAGISHLKHISVRGLMTIGALTGDLSVVRSCFKRLRDLRGRIQEARIEDVSMDYLSMGMTSDFEVAIEEGSNMVRIGTAIFGPRQEAAA
jgi:pyridoxal phosphate enzyme (YggS family)